MNALAGEVGSTFCGTLIQDLSRSQESVKHVMLSIKAMKDRGDSSSSSEAKFQSSADVHQELSRAADNVSSTHMTKK